MKKLGPVYFKFAAHLDPSVVLFGFSVMTFQFLKICQKSHDLTQTCSLRFKGPVKIQICLLRFAPVPAQAQNNNSIKQNVMFPPLKEESRELSRKERKYKTRKMCTAKL